MSLADEALVQSMREAIRSATAAGGLAAVERLVVGDDCVVLGPGHPVAVKHGRGLSWSARDGQPVIREECPHVVADVRATDFWTPAEPALLQCRRCVEAWLPVIRSRVCHGCLRFGRGVELRWARVPLFLDPGWLELWLGVCPKCIEQA